jgi:hypothetical protein
VCDEDINSETKRIEGIFGGPMFAEYAAQSSFTLMNAFMQLEKA